MSYDHLVTERRVTCGPCALNRAGLISFVPDLLYLQTGYKSIDGVSTVCITYWYYENIDYDHWVTPSRSNPLILQPTKERSIIDYMRNEKWCDEGLLIEALKSYLMWFRDDEKLYEVAEFYGVNKDTVNYWINEALTDEEI